MKYEMQVKVVTPKRLQENQQVLMRKYLPSWSDLHRQPGLAYLLRMKKILIF